MKIIWTKSEVLANRGCYEREQVEALFGATESVTLPEIMEWSIPITDKRWFLFNKGQMTLDQEKALALICAKVVLPIYEEKYPADKRVRDCLDGIDKFNRGEISRGGLLKLRTAAYAAAGAATDAAAAAGAATYAAAAAAGAAYAAATDAAAAAGAATYAAAAAAGAATDADDAATDADDAAADAAYADAYAAYAAADAAADAAAYAATGKTTYGQRLKAAFIEFIASQEVPEAV